METETAITDEPPAHAHARQTVARFVAVSRFVIANGLVDEVKEAFRNRPRKVEQAEGVVALEVLSPLDAPAEIHLMTWWTDEKSFHAWHRSHAYHASHEGIPKGLKLLPRETTLRYFEHVAR